MTDNPFLPDDDLPSSGEDDLASSGEDDLRSSDEVDKLEKLDEPGPLEEKLGAAPLPPLEAPFPDSAAASPSPAPAAPAPAPPSAQLARPQASARPRREERASARGPRPDLSSSIEPLYRDDAGYRMRLEPPDLARLRELPGSKGKSDHELGETFFDGQAARFSASLAEDVPTPADVRVVVDPYSRQAFLAVEKKIRSIVSF